MIRRLAPFALGLAALGMLVPSVPRAEGARTKAPDFRVADLAGEKVSLKDLLGKGPIVVDFWATWCKPCLKELPYVDRIREKYADRGVQVLAVTIDSPKSQSQVKRYIDTHKYGFTVLLDPEQEVFRKLQGKGSIPYVVVLDAEGNIRYQHTGYRPGDENELERVVAELLGDAPGSAPGGEDADAAAEEAAAEGSAG